MSTCASCGRDNRPETSSCEGCGRRLVAAERVGERRQLTVMFCDLVDSTELAQRLDPEDLGEVMHAYQARCTEAIERYEGHVAQLLGDGLLVYFGYPRAHEEDALRAVRAALEIREALPRLNEGLAERVPLLRERPLQVRLGLHTGPVVIDEFGGGDRRERLALGDTVNVASRLLGVARPGQAVISAGTRRLVEGGFVLEDLGDQTLRGVDRPVLVHRVVGPDPASEERGPSGWGRRAPFVGRERELAFLLESWDRAKRGEGRAVLVRGEAGIGKSRLVQCFTERTADQPRFSFDCHCSPFRVHSALYPVFSSIPRALGFAADDPAEAQLAKLEKALERVDLEPDVVLPLLAPLFSLPLPEQHRNVALSREAWRRRTFDRLLAWMLQLARRRPVVLVVEDLQWIDASTRELLELFLERVHDAPILALLTARTEFEPRWGAHARVAECELAPLAESHVTTMVEGVAGDDPLPAEVVAEVVARADGVPLFVEELTRTILEQYASDPDSCVGAVAGVSIPSTLQGSLMARLDRLGPAKEVAQQAAVLGREFRPELLEAISPLEPASLREQLDRLEAAQLIQHGPDRSTSIFRHALSHEVAYQSLLRAGRRVLHARVAETLEERFAERSESEPEVIAWHCEMAGRTAEAISHHQRAAERAMRASAHPEAIGHLAKALDLLATLPESPERDRRELALRVALGVPLISARGYGNPEVEQTHRRARELCREVGEGPDLYQALGGIYLFHTARAELKPAAELAAQLLELGERAGDPFVRQWGHFFSAPPHFYRGEFAAAVDHAEQAIALQDPGRRLDWYVHEHDADVSARVYAAMGLWNLGHPDQAAARMAEAVELGSESAHPWNHAFALAFAALFHHMRREPERVQERAEQAVEVAAEQGFPVWLGIGTLLKGWARAQAGEDPVDEVLRGLRESSATGTRIEGPRVLGLLAEIHRAVGRGRQALDTLDSALALSRDKQCFYWDAELHRLRGETLIAQRAATEAVEDCYRRALEAAKRQGARSLALRAAVSLARLRQREGRPGEAAPLLDELHGGFTEGRDTPDLQEAGALLDELRVGRGVSQHRVRER